MQYQVGSTDEAYALQVRVCSANECHQKYFDNHLKNDSFVLHGLISLLYALFCDRYHPY